MRMYRVINISIKFAYFLLLQHRRLLALRTRTLAPLAAAVSARRLATARPATAFGRRRPRVHRITMSMCGRRRSSGHR